MWSFVKVVLWGIAWFPVWILSLPFREKGQENCLTWALKKWNTEGGYIVIRWCRHSKYSWFTWPHFLWLAEEHHTYLEHVVPIDDNPMKKHVIPAPWFDPKHAKGDDEELMEN